MYSGEDLAASLKFPSITKLFDACTYYGLTTSQTGVIFTKGAFNHETPLVSWCFHIAGLFLNQFHSNCIFMQTAEYHKPIPSTMHIYSSLVETILKG